MKKYINSLLVFLLLVLIVSPVQLFGQCANESNVYSFNYDGKTYEVIKEKKIWIDAAACAVERGGYLAEINSQAEQDAIFNQLINNAAIDNSQTIAVNGGGASYLWLGGNDMATEGKWILDGNNDGIGSQFWQGLRNGSAVGGLYNNWGKEPDNAKNKQDALSIAITQWPLSSGSLGSAGQWNDVNQDNKLFYIVEYDTLKGNETVGLIGSGTEADPYQIATLEDLVWLAKTDSVWSDSLYFKQTADIDAAPTDTMVIGGFNPGWSPIGNATTSFKGTYDGNGFVIDKLTTHGHNGGVALFGVVEGGITIKDLGLTNARMTVGHFSGTLLGSAKGEIIVENCYATGTLEAQGIAGGLIGQIDYTSNMSITNCYTEVTVTNSGQGDYTMTGGFVGQILAATGTVSECYSTGDVSSNPDADAKLFTAGFIGLFDNVVDSTRTTITKCYSTGTVTGSPIVTLFSPAGGFAAAVYHNTTVSECYSTGNVINAGKDTGGFAGYVKYSGAKVTNCYERGNVTRSSGSTQPNFGGFCGMTNSGGTISKSYSIGSVVFEGEDNPTGYGFIGNSSGNDSLCYFDKETSMQDSTLGDAMAKTTAEMKTEATFIDWDFTDVWQIIGDNYPTLKTTPVSVDGTELDVIPTAYKLEQNYPNPFNPATVISFALPSASDVQLSVYNIIGEKITELVNSNMSAGNHTVNFNAINLASGMYIYRIKAGNFVSVKKMLLLK